MLELNLQFHEGAIASICLLSATSIAAEHIHVNKTRVIRIQSTVGISFGRFHSVTPEKRQPR